MNSLRILLLLYMVFFFGLQRGMAETHIEDQGRKVYLTYGCALCHGKNGDGRGINARNFDPEPTDFRDPKYYRHGSNKESIRRSIKYGIQEQASVMPAFEHLTKEELDELTAFIFSMQIKN